MLRASQRGFGLLLLLATCAAPPSRTADSPGLAFPTTLGEGSDQPGRERRLRRAPENATAPDEPSVAGASGAAAPAAAEVSVSSPAGAPTSREASDPAAAGRAAEATSPPDPEPLRTAAQWQYEVAWDAGELSVASVKRVELGKPVVTPRRMGRYAIELWIGAELVERVRFDLPLLAGEPPSSTGRAFPAPDLEKGAHVRTRVLVPHAERARRAVLVDRARGERLELPWPPDRPAAIR